MNITYTFGDLFSNLPRNKDITIAHVCNNNGAWGAGFSGELSKLFPLAKHEYKYCNNLYLGLTQFISCNRVIIANMIAQDGIGTQKRRLNYPALVDCMRKIDKGPIYCPMFGAGLAGGNWEFIEALIEDIWCVKGIEVNVFKFKK